MMETIILAIVLVLAAVAGLAVGVLFGRAPLKGSCGGVNCGDCACGRERAP
jgi:hypothetical protein